MARSLRTPGISRIPVPRPPWAMPNSEPHAEGDGGISIRCPGSGQHGARAGSSPTEARPGLREGQSGSRRRSCRIGRRDPDWPKAPGWGVLSRRPETEAGWRDPSAVPMPMKTSVSNRRPLRDRLQKTPRTKSPVMAGGSRRLFEAELPVDGPLVPAQTTGDLRLREPLPGQPVDLQTFVGRKMKTGSHAEPMSSQHCT